MSKDQSKKTIVVRATQPVTAEGTTILMAAIGDLEFLVSLNSMEAATQLVNAQPPDVVIADKGFGTRPAVGWIHDLILADTRPAVTAWGVSVPEAKRMYLLHPGAKGIVHRTADLESILSYLHAVASGRYCVFSDPSRRERYRRRELTSREVRVLEMVEQGFKNKELALESGVRSGTVKIPVKHISEKNCLMRAS